MTATTNNTEPAAATASRVNATRRFRPPWVGVIIVLTLLAGCTPATLKPRDGYWADKSLSAQAYNHRVRFVVLHYTTDDEARSVRVLTGPAVSSHYLVAPQPDNRGGKPIVRQFVPESERAWHAGVSSWAGRHHINDSSIGIEIVNLGRYRNDQGELVWDGYSAAQMQTVAALLRDIIARYDIEPQNIVGHADVSPGRKIDPGPAFPWQWLHEQGIGAWPDAQRVAFYRQRFAQCMPDVAAIQQALARYGYDLPVTGTLDAATRKTLISFQMHFRPELYDGIPDIETVARLWALADQYRPDTPRAPQDCPA